MALLDGEIALIAILLSKNCETLQRRTLLCISAPSLLPTILDGPPELQFQLKVVRPARVIRAETSPEHVWQSKGFSWAALPDQQAVLSIFHGTEATTQLAKPELDPARIIVDLLCERYGCRLRPLLEVPADFHDRLLALLEQADLIVRPVSLERRDLWRDCGDLIYLSVNGPLLLLSQPRGYRIVDPAIPAARQACPLTRREIRQWSQPLRALEVLPALQSSDLSANGLVNFSFGAAKQQSAVFIAATVLGLLIGFALAIGREVGAARWIAGLGGAGALIGLGLALLSGSLRLPFIAALLSTLIGLLVPTMNTLLTNVALPDKDVSLMLQMGGLLLMAALADVGLRWAESRSLLSVQERGGHRLELAALHRLLSLPTAFFRNYRVGDLSLRFGAIGQVQQEVQSLLSGGALQTLLSGVFLLFMLRISVKLTALALVLALLLVGPTIWIGRRTLRLERQREVCLAEANSRNIELISSVAKLRLAGVESSAARYWWHPYQEAIGMRYAAEARAALAGILSIIMPNIGTLLLFVVITRLVAEAARNPLLILPNLGELLGFFSAFATFIGAVASASSLMVQAFELPVLLERAKPLLFAQPETRKDSIDPGRLQGRVDFTDICFRYRDRGAWVLEGFNLTIQPGEFIAVVGPTGSGKTTLSRLLLGVETPERGVILLDGRPLERLRIELVRRQIGVVPQNTTLLAGSIHEVIAGGAEITPEEAWRAAEGAAVADEIRSLPMGMYTLLPEGGGSLSGGQRQRLAIARALARRPRLLILDEATSSLDNITQAKVSQSLSSLGLTRLVIAHRLSTIRHADRIIVLQAGQIAQEGRFEELITKGGPFLDLMQRQLTDENTDAGPPS